MDENESVDREELREEIVKDWLRVTQRDVDLEDVLDYIESYDLDAELLDVSPFDELMSELESLAFHIKSRERGLLDGRIELLTTVATARPFLDALFKDIPALRIHFDGSHDRLRQGLSERLRDDIAVEEIDVSFRHLSSDGEPAEGILALSDRVTGRYIVEVKTAANLVREFVQAMLKSADQMSHDARYRVEIRAEGETVTTFEKDLLVVYDASGTLLRDASLIPTGIEL